MSHDYDVIIIGAGVGGLTCASLLAKQGLKVLVLERLNRVGGLCSNYDRDGFRPDVGVVWMITPEIIFKLFELLDKRLEDYVELTVVDPVYHLSLGESGEHLLPRDFKGVEDAIASISPPDVENYRRFCADFKKLGDMMEAFFSGHMPDIYKLKNISTWAKMAARKELIPLLPAGLKMALNNLDSLTMKYFKDPRVQYIFGWESILSGLRSNRARGLFLMGGYLGRTGYYCIKNGTINLPLALRCIAEDFGAEVRLSADVESIVIENGKAGGVRIRYGEPAGAGECRRVCGLPYPCDKMSRGEPPAASETLTARAVISNAHSRVTYLDLVGRENLPGWAARTVRRQPSSMAAPAIFVGLKEKLDNIPAHFSVAMNVKVGEGSVWSEQLSSIWADYYDRGIFYPPMDGFYFVINPAFADASLAPPGKQVLTIHYMSPYKLAHHDWDDIADEWSQEVINHLDRKHYPGLAERVEWMDSVSPKEMERRFNLPEGGLYGLPFLSLSNMGPFRPHHRSKLVEGLYLAGHCTNPGASVPLVMVSGMITSSLILNDWKTNL